MQTQTLVLEEICFLEYISPQTGFRYAVCLDQTSLSEEIQVTPLESPDTYITDFLGFKQLINQLDAR